MLNIDAIINGINENKERIFSGIGVFVLGLFFKSLHINIKKQKGGSNSTNIQSDKIIYKK